MSAVKNALSNFLGAAVPALVLFMTVPIMVKGLGQAQYGLLIILSSITGYLAVLDINLTASSVKFLSEAKALDRKERISQVISFSFAFYGFIGLVGALLMYVFAAEIVGWLVDPKLYAEENAILVLKICAFGFALGQIYTFVLSIPQALQRYDLSAKVEITNGLLVPFATAGIVLLGAELVGVVWLRNVASLLAIVAVFVLVKSLLPNLLFSWPERELRKDMLSFSGYAYLNRLASLSYQHSDKLVIAAVLDVRQVAVYAIPVMLANRIMGTTYRLIQVIFPISSALLAQGRKEEVVVLMQQGMRYVFALNVMATVSVILLGEWFLSKWLDASYARDGTSVLIFITVGALIDSITNAPALVTDGAGKPKVTGSFAVARAVVGLLALYVGAKFDGIRGVALSHLLTSFLFSILFLLFFVRRILPLSGVSLVRQTIAPGVVLASVGLTGGYLIQAMIGRDTVGLLSSAALSLIVMVIGSWIFVVSEAHKKSITARIFNK